MSGQVQIARVTLVEEAAAAIVTLKFLVYLVRRHVQLLNLADFARRRDDHRVLVVEDGRRHDLDNGAALAKDILSAFTSLWLIHILIGGILVFQFLVKSNDVFAGLPHLGQLQFRVSLHHDFLDIPQIFDLFNYVEFFI